MSSANVNSCPTYFSLLECGIKWHSVISAERRVFPSTNESGDRVSLVLRRTLCPSDCLGHPRRRRVGYRINGDNNPDG